MNKITSKEPLTLLKYFKGLGHKSSLMISATYVMEVIREHPHLEHVMYFKYFLGLNLNGKTWKLLYLIHLTMSKTFILCTIEPSEEAAK